MHYATATETFDQLFIQGVALHKTAPEKALLFFKQALSLNPQSTETLYNIAYVLKNMGRAHESLEYYNKVIAQEPDNTGAHIGRAQAHLMVGNYTQGWQDLEWRLGGPYSYTQECARYLLHNQSLRNKKILLRAEWGIGDTLMFIRYAQLFHEQGAYVMVHLIHESLVPLLRAQPYIDEVFGPDQPAPAFHLQVPMISLPIVFGTTLENMAWRIPYICVDNRLQTYWKNYLTHDNSIKIGICWHGNTIHSSEKFIPLWHIAHLANMPGISLYSLQKKHGLEQLADQSFAKTIKLLPDFVDQTPFLDTAAIMKNLDLVITVDTSIAHLAGALGIPVWVVLPHIADWRWMQSRTDSPWYPTMKLFRQSSQDNWTTVIDAMCLSLKQTFTQLNIF
jgi:tetratricopeptide (TPR) repeat protein